MPSSHYRRTNLTCLLAGSHGARRVGAWGPAASGRDLGCALGGRGDPSPGLSEAQSSVTRPGRKGLPNRPPRRFQGCPKPRGPWRGSRPQLRLRRSRPLSCPGQPRMGPVQQREVGLGFPSVEAQKATRVLHHQNPPRPRGWPTGGSLASSPARTWLLAPRLPCPARSPHARQRLGNCCGPGCSTPPPWGCGMGSCRSRLGRRRRLQAGVLNRAPLPRDTTRTRDQRALGL